MKSAWQRRKEKSAPRTLQSLRFLARKRQTKSPVYGPHALHDALKAVAQREKRRGDGEERFWSAQRDHDQAFLAISSH